MSYADSESIEEESDRYVTEEEAEAMQEFDMGEDEFFSLDPAEADRLVFLAELMRGG